MTARGGVRRSGAHRRGVHGARARLVAAALLLCALALPVVGQTPPPGAGLPPAGAGAFSQAGPAAGPGAAESGAAESGAAAAVTAAAEYSPPRTALGAWMRARQLELSGALTQVLRRVQRGEADGTFRLIIAISFLYGIIHSLLPGHRKALLFSFFLAEDARIVTGLLAGVALAAVHAGGAIALVFTAYFVLESSVAASVTDTAATVQTISAILVIAVGVWLTVVKLREALGHGHDHATAPVGHAVEHAPEAGADHDHATAPVERSRRLLPVIILSGIVPCPGSTMILIFAISLGVIRLGLLAVGAFAVGMAIALSALAVTTIIVKGRIHALLESRGGHTAHHVIEIGSALFMLGFGIFLFSSNVL